MKLGRALPPRAAAALTFALCLAFAARARANGRYPYAQQLEEQPGHAARLWLRTTYGILSSADSGGTWHWICEDAVGYSGQEDPALGVFGDGTVMAGLAAGLSETHDEGCDWSFVGQSGDAGPGAHFIADVTVDPNDASKALVLVSASEGGSTYLNQIWQTTDAGKSFTQVGADLDANAELFTLDTAPSDARRVYVSAVFRGGANGQGGLLRSEDAGKSWQRLDIPGTSLLAVPYIAAVSRTDPGAVYVRANGESNGVADTLYYSDGAGAAPEAGATWRVLIQKRAELFGFALSPDGATVLAGFGKPDSTGVAYDASALGIWSAGTSAQSFTKIFDGPISCLEWTSRGVYACANQDQSFELGLSTNQGKTFQRLLALDGVLGPLECPASSSAGMACAGAWANVCKLIGRCGSDGGAPAAGGASSGTAAKSTSSSCGCELPRRGRRDFGALGAALAVLGLWSWRRRRAS
jgi:hypothetical protein